MTTKIALTEDEQSLVRIALLDLRDRYKQLHQNHWRNSSHDYGKDAEILDRIYHQMIDTDTIVIGDID